MSSVDHDSEELSQKELRLQHPSGWLYLTQHDSVPILIDGMLDLPPRKEFNKIELAEHTGVSRQTVANYIPLLLELQIVEEVEGTNPTRYRVAQSDVVQEIHELNSALNAVPPQ